LATRTPALRVTRNITSYRLVNNRIFNPHSQR
jgi:hypothetical protein